MKVRLLKKLRKMYLNVWRECMNFKSCVRRRKFWNMLFPQRDYAYLPDQVSRLNNVFIRFRHHSAEWLEANHSRFYVKTHEGWSTSEHLDVEQTIIYDRVCDRGMYKQFRLKWENRSRKYYLPSRVLMRSIANGEVK